MEECNEILLLGSLKAAWNGAIDISLVVLHFQCIAPLSSWRPLLFLISKPTPYKQPRKLSLFTLENAFNSYPITQNAKN